MTLGIRQWYWDFGPTLAAEKLHEDHGVVVGRETLRQWMIADGLWRDRKQRKRIHRLRRECVGELVQVDGSEHWWFEDRGPQCTLLVFVDDATSRLMHLQFIESESTFAYFHAARTYLEVWGKPVAFYSDKHGVSLDGCRSGGGRRHVSDVPKAEMGGSGKRHGNRRTECPRCSGGSRDRAAASGSDTMTQSMPDDPRRMADQSRCRLMVRTATPQA
jgi:hypothetical protein